MYLMHLVEIDREDQRLPNKGRVFWKYYNNISLTRERAFIKARLPFTTVERGWGGGGRTLCVRAMIELVTLAGSNPSSDFKATKTRDLYAPQNTLMLFKTLLS